MTESKLHWDLANRLGSLQSQRLAPVLFEAYKKGSPTPMGVAVVKFSTVAQLNVFVKSPGLKVSLERSFSKQYYGCIVKIILFALSFSNVLDITN